MNVFLKTRFLAILWSFHFFGLISYSQQTSTLPNPLKFEQLSMKDGLSMNPVMDISQDKKGFLWFATQDGLNRHDGYSFLIHKNRLGDSTSLSDNLLTTIFNDKNGNLWVGTLNGGIQCLDMSQEKFKRYSLQKQSSNDLTPKTVWKVYEDSKGFIWLGTIAGLLRLDRQTGTVINAKELHKDFAPLGGNSVISILESEPGVLWVGMESGLYRANINSGKLKLFSHNPEDSHSLSDNLVLSIFMDKKENLWIGTADGLNLFHPETENFTNQKFTLEVKKNIKSGFKKNKVQRKFSIFDTFDPSTIRCITEGEDGMLWIGTDLGLIHFNPQNNQHRRHQHELAQPNSICSDLVRSVFIDNSGNLWVGTISAGISKLNLKPRKFEHFENKLNNPYNFIENYIRSILEDRKGNLWIGAVLGGLVLKSANTGKITNYIKKEIDDGTSINNDNVWSIFEDKEGFIWLGTSFGLNRYDPVKRNFEYFISIPEENQTLSNNSIRCIFQDSRGLLWVGTENGINIFDSKSRKFKRIFKIVNISNSLSDNLVWKILEDNDGFIWIGTNNGLNKYDIVKDTFYTFKNIPSDTNSLSNNGIRTLYKDKAGYIWIGTQIGLNRMDPQTGKNWSFFEKDGLPNNFIYCILEDDKGGIWVSTNKGLSQLDPVSLRFKNFDIDDGLQDFEYNTNSCCKSNSSEMYFGGPNGLNRFNPEKIKDNLFVPPIIITEIKILNKSIRSNIPVSDIKELKLNYTENILYFEFSALDFTSPLKNEYAYLMEGFNSEWTYSGNRRSVNYTNLDPGEYTFRVRATNSDGYWNGDGPAIRIVITPPFWKTKWFYIFCVLFVITFIFLYIKWHERKLKIEKKILENKVEERTTELKKEKEKIEEINIELEKLSIVASKTDNAVLILDPTGKIEWVNTGFEKLNGITLSELIKLKGETIFEISNSSNIRNIYHECIKEKKSVVYESLNFTTDKRKVWESSTMTPIFDDQQMLKKIIIIDQNITERKETEEIIRQKSKDILDSITYAKNIQEAILPPKINLYNSFPGAFILFKPKDIVSGDFYWFNKVIHHSAIGFENTENKVFAAVDCTGHGVPGAFMSMIGNDMLNQFIIEKNNIIPGKVLSLLNDGIHTALKQKEKAKSLRDGMDIGLCCISNDNRNLQFSGAFRPLWIVRNNELIEIRGDRYSIGGFTEPGTSFTNHEIPLEPGDSIYIFTDGFADQLGEKINKKLLTKNFKNLLLEIREVPMRKQEQILLNYFDDWKGREVQTDDCLVIGIQI